MNLNIRKMIVLLSLLVVLIPITCLGLLEEDEEIIKSFMPGVIRRVAVVPGQQVKRGDLLCILEAMKMECSIRSPRAGLIGSLCFTVDQYIENDMPLITILPFIPKEKEGDSMEVDESPLPTSQDNEPYFEDISQEDVSSTAEQLTSEIGVEPETYHQEETLILVTAPATEILNNEEDISDVSSPKIVITRPVEQSVSEDEPQRSQQEETLLLVAAPITEETFDNEGEGAEFSLFEVDSEIYQQEEMLSLVAAPITETLNTKENVSDVSSSPGVVACESKQSIPEHQVFHQVSAPYWIASVYSHHSTSLAVTTVKVFNDDKADILSSPQKVKAEEFQQGVNSLKGSTYLFWLTRLLLLIFLSFCRSGGILPYHIRNILTPKTAENLNIPEYLRDAA
ncbi:MAG: acetyl-CoA carboxylase biotin carboxyl carrier protein subunit [Alphaproteobacteria bacterium]|nr:acetyl-CoA carboxylase biotin carboxyl carrier protein subunit [Alphaproteobacteria bacterium]